MLVVGVALVGMTGAANYMYETTQIKGVGYDNAEVITQTQPGLAGNKLVFKQAGSGTVAQDKRELEVERDPFGPECSDADDNERSCCVDYINFTQQAELEYQPVSYQTGTYDEKWISKLCTQNYYIGAVAVEMYTHAEHLQKNTEVKTRRDCGVWENCDDNADDCTGCGDCTGALEANFNSNIIGVAHIGWLSRDVSTNCKGRHYEYGRSVEDMTGVFSIEKFIQLWGNGTCGTVQVEWLPCL
jgi:hypothetical protein